MAKFVTFEGGEGSGKSTLIEGLKKYFEKNCIDYIATREPGGLQFCEEVRKILKYGEYKIGGRAELLMFSASRAELCDEVIKPALDEGKVVLCDRFFDSTRVYQGYAAGIPDDEIMSVTDFATNSLVPEVTFFLDIDPEIAFMRKGGRDSGDRIEERALEYHKKVREGYLHIARAEDRFVIIDATLSREEVLSQVIEKLKEKKIIE